MHRPTARKIWPTLQLWHPQLINSGFIVSNLEVEPFQIYHTLWGKNVPPGKLGYHVEKSFIG